MATHPEVVQDKNGKMTTVHKGRSDRRDVAGAKNRVASAPAVPPIKVSLTEGASFVAVYGDTKLDFEIISFDDRKVVAVADDEEYGIVEKEFPHSAVEAGLRYTAQYEGKE